MRRAPSAAVLLIGALCAGMANAQGAVDADYDVVAQILSKERKTRVAAAEALERAGDASFVPALVDAVFFTPRESRREVFRALTALTGESFSDYYDWVEYVGAHPEIEPAPGYLEWKLSLLERIDDEYRTVFYSGAPSRIRLEEIVWGGVPMAGIPAVDAPPVIAGTEAKYLKDKEMVFGLVLEGEARAYPLRILSWHEMLNDTLGGRPITLSFCTLCGSGIFFDTRTPNGGSYEFDTSGLLYRSNKLMVDRRSRTLWGNLTGEPVVGRLARLDTRLPVLPGTLTTWKAWLQQNPQTTVLDLDGIKEQMRPRYSYDYRPGAADRSRRGVSFPVWQKSDRLERDAEVFTVRLEDAVRAYPVESVLEVGVINDDVGGEPVLVLGDEESRAIRAYRRGSNTFRRSDTGELLDETGREWLADEQSVAVASDGDPVPELERIPGHVALWFGWFGFFPQTEVWPD